MGRREDGSDGTAQAALRGFLEVADQFRLGELPTEQPHPATVGLSGLSREDPAAALRIFHALDSHALEVVEGQLPALEGLAARIGEVFDAGGSVFLAGCGSTGRLSLTCESLWRKEWAGTPPEKRVSAFMAGGDYAMVRSLESFEDHPGYGARQLKEAGFRDGDLLLASTEGGETPFVIGAAMRAAEISRQSPVFLYCNPDAALRRVAARSAAILDDGRIEKIRLETGPMALSGSTRLQASTALMAAVGGALFAHRRPRDLATWLRSLIDSWNGLATGFMVPFVEREADVYLRGGHLRYHADADLAMSILTDTTERAPTFSLPPFSNDMDHPPRPSPCSLRLPHAPDRETAWRMLLGRPPRGLEWPELGDAASRARVMGFDFSRANARGLPEADPDPRAVFSITRDGGAIRLSLGPEAAAVPIGGLAPLSVHLVLKMLLNAHSTLVMGRLGRFDGNVMTWVRPSNHKLVDRAIRYAGQILTREGIRAGYAELAEACFALRNSLPHDAPLVPAMADYIRRKAAP